MKLLVQDYLVTHSLEDLFQEHGIRCGLYDHLISLNYHQINAKATDPMAQQCRGVVLRHFSETALQPTEIVGNTFLAAWPFSRFFNSHEGSCAEIDWSTAEIQEKLDGTLCILYYDFQMSKWNVGTRNTPYAQFSSNPFETQTIRQLFEEGLHNLTGLSVDDFANLLDKKKEHTWTFELTSPVNRIVVEYSEVSITALGCRHNMTGKEKSPKQAMRPFGVPIPKTYCLSDLNDVISFVQKRPPKQYEGVVVCDTQFNRMKVKSAAYALANHLQGRLASSPRKITEILLEEGWDDVSGQLPDYIKEQGDLMQTALKNILQIHIRALGSIAEEMKSLGITDTSSREYRKAYVLAGRSVEGVDIKALMNSYGQGVECLIDWFHCRGSHKASNRTGHLKRITSMIQTEMRRNGTDKKEFWEVTKTFKERQAEKAEGEATD